MPQINIFVRLQSLAYVCLGLRGKVSFKDSRKVWILESPLFLNFKLNWWFRTLGLRWRDKQETSLRDHKQRLWRIASDFWEVFAIVFTSKIFSNFCWNALKSSNISLCRAAPAAPAGETLAPTQWCWHIYVSNYMSSNMTRALVCGGMSGDQFLRGAEPGTHNIRLLDNLC